jgi:hypothetical protein
MSLHALHSPVLFAEELWREWGKRSQKGAWAAKTEGGHARAAICMVQMALVCMTDMDAHQKPSHMMGRLRAMLNDSFAAVSNYYHLSSVSHFSAYLYWGRRVKDSHRPGDVCD